jgi:hypothetical protein
MRIKNLPFHNLSVLAWSDWYSSWVGIGTLCPIFGLWVSKVRASGFVGPWNRRKGKRGGSSGLGASTCPCPWASVHGWLRLGCGTQLGVKALLVASSRGFRGFGSGLW